MFVPSAAQLAKDWAARAVDFGGYAYYMFFQPRMPGCTPLPRKPERVGVQCLCPSCASEGWFAQSPACNFWRAHCELCSGTREWVHYPASGGWTRLPCDLCEQAWQDDVRFFRDALRSPRRTAEKLRAEASRHAA
ncbi:MULTISPECIES: hypothetical protein [Amycolatopsis]|uniref:Uncharacterized protein n=1 Tax=Amycolatopsis saalfeldensis TaxID=394193 RepID=A0A1H8YNL6_9PSEU|nr:MULTISPECIES: hypothetical protein [Amycolatopsis]SEP53683.1 hypothetical protein SAMN04489732_129129 [Amycolatopsis saalfeldensis]